jgi:hypothetical protein
VARGRKRAGIEGAEEEKHPRGSAPPVEDRARLAPFGYRPVCEKKRHDLDFWCPTEPLRRHLDTKALEIGVF